MAHGFIKTFRREFNKPDGAKEYVETKVPVWVRVSAIMSIEPDHKGEGTKIVGMGPIWVAPDDMPEDVLALIHQEEITP